MNGSLLRALLVTGVSASLALLGACGDDGGSGGGDVHALGEEVTVGYVEYGEAGESAVEHTIGITPLEVRTGTHEELAEGGLEVDEEDKDTTPYYVDVRYENQGDEAVKKNLDVDFEDADGNLISSTVIFNFGDTVFKPCPAVTEGRLEPGDSYESCTLILVPEGVEPARISFLSQPSEDESGEFVYWEID